MMKELWKLFKRDRIYLLCLAGAVVFVLLYGMTGCFKAIELAEMQQAGFDMALYTEKVNTLLRLWGGTEPGALYTNVLRIAFFIAAAAQIIRWHILEGKHGKEFQKLLPVKGKSCVTYDFICGIFFVWVPVMVSWPFIDNWLKGLDNYSSYYSAWTSDRAYSLLIVNTFLYVLLVFSRKMTNHIPGAVFSSIIIGFGFYCIQWYTKRIIFFGDALPVGSLGGIVLTAVIVNCIVLTYLCDKSRDISGNGVFCFKTAHYLILCILLAELIAVFVSFLKSAAMGKAAGTVVGVLLAEAVCFGVHCLAKPKEREIL